MSTFHSMTDSKGRHSAELTLKPVDDRALTNLCGARDANLRQIENTLDVKIVRRGATFLVRGVRSNAAMKALHCFYTQAQKPLNSNHIALGLTELCKDAAGAESSEQPEPKPAKSYPAEHGMHTPKGDSMSDAPKTPKPKFKLVDWRLGGSAFAGMVIYIIFLVIEGGGTFDGSLPTFWFIPAGFLTAMIYATWNKASPRK
jgi:hypothetical protein